MISFIWAKYKVLTKDKEVQAFIWHIFIDQTFFLSFNAASYKPNQICMLQFRYKFDFIPELCKTLPWMRCKPFNCNFLPIW
jgi:hypothetical protein